MRRLLSSLVKKWLLRQAMFAPLFILLLIGFRSGRQTMTPEERWHPAFKPAGTAAALVLAAMALGWLPFDAMALGVLLFILVGAAGIAALALGYEAIQMVYKPMAQTMMFAWIALVFAVLASWRPAKLMGLPPGGRRLRPAAWATAGLAAAAAGFSWALRDHEELAGFLPFLALVGARFLARKWAHRGPAGR